MRRHSLSAFWRIMIVLLIISAAFNNLPVSKAAQSGPELWSQEYAGSGAWEAKLYDMAIDKTGNIILAGAVWQANQPDFVTLKYSKTGELLWENTYNGPASINDEARAVVVDDGGNVYVTGFSATRASFEDYYTIKYNSEGTLIWEARHSGSGNQPDIATVLVLHRDYLYVTGHSVNENGANIITTIKYAGADGGVVWKKNHAGHSTSAIFSDSQGNIYVAGVQLNDTAILKYAPDGSEVWTAYYDDPDGKVSSPKAMVLDKDENILVIGNAGDKIVVFKMASAGDMLWSRQFSGAFDAVSTPGSIAVDGEGNVYVCGSGWMNSDGYNDALARKYSPEGNLLWEASYNGPASGNDFANDLLVNQDGVVYVATSSTGDLYKDSTVLKYSPKGGLVQVLRYRNEDNRSYEAFTVGLDKSANLIVGGEINMDQGILLVKYGQDPGPEIYLEDVIVTEGNTSKDAGEVHLYVRLNSPLHYAVSVDYHTIAGSANPGEDFKSSQGTLLIEPGNNNGHFELSIVGDTLPETDELFYVDFSTPTNASLFTSRAYVTIREDDRNLLRWIVRYDNPAGIHDVGIDLEVDPDGNLVIIGGSSGGGVLFNRLFKYDPDGNLIWEKIVNSQSNLLALDQLGNIYLAGGSEADELILSKYDSQGSLKWEYSFIGPTGLGGHFWDLAIDPSGNVAVAGSYIVSGDEFDAIIGALTMKFDPQGVLLWSQVTGTTQDDWGGAEKIATDRGGNILTARESITPAGRSLVVLNTVLMATCS